MHATRCGLAASLAASLMLAALPACAGLPVQRPPSRHAVEVTDPSGASYIAPASELGIGFIDRHAGEFTGHELSLDGAEAWGFLSVVGVIFSIGLVGPLVMFIVRAIEEAMYDEAEGSS